MIVAKKNEQYTLTLELGKEEAEVLRWVLGATTVNNRGAVYDAIHGMYRAIKDAGVNYSPLVEPISLASLRQV